MKVNKVFLSILIMALSGFAMQPVQAAMKGKMEMSGAHEYFEHHTFNFKSYFYQYHPGPHWDLVNAKKLHLSPAQIKTEKHLVEGMKSDTMRGIRELKAAYRRFKNDAAQSSPKIKINVIIHDVKAVGRAQAFLAYEMVPYHVKGYRLLDHSQRRIYKRLARENWMKITRMSKMHKQQM